MLTKGTYLSIESIISCEKRKNYQLEIVLSFHSQHLCYFCKKSLLFLDVDDILYKKSKY